MALLIAAALLGLFGTGPLSRTTAGDEAGPLWLEYERFARLLAPAPLSVHVGPGAERGGIIRVWIDRRYLDSVELQEVTPQPDSTAVGAERLIFSFRQAEDEGAAVITFNMRPSRFGSLPGRVGLIGGPALPVPAVCLSLNPDQDVRPWTPCFEPSSSTLPSGCSFG
jgi:hypothetical protein